MFLPPQPVVAPRLKCKSAPFHVRSAPVFLLHLSQADQSMIVASQIELIRGGRKLLDNASATIHPGHKVGLVGKNGCGKSTFFALVRGELAIDSGTFSTRAPT